MRFLPTFNSAVERAVTHIEALRVQRPEQPKLEVGEDLGLLSARLHAMVRADEQTIGDP